MPMNNRTYLGSGDWMELCVAPPPAQGQVDIPLRDVAPMVIEVLRRDLLDAGQTLLILEAAEQSLLRKADARGDGRC